jgi:hypothetical protein
MKLSAIAVPAGLGYAGQRLHRDVTHVISALEVQRDNVPSIVPTGAVNLKAFFTAALTYLNTATGSGETTAPTLAITASVLEVPPAGTSVITFTFSEPVLGFTVSDAVAVGGTLSELTFVSDTVRTAVYTRTTGTPSVTVANASFTDVVGNAGVGDVLDATDGFVAGA